MDIEAFVSSLNTAYPATITAFNPEEQTATVKLAIEKFYSGIDTGELFEKFDRPEVEDVPVHFPQCQGFALTMPVKVGDSCLVIFAQRGIGHWLYRGEEEAGRNPVSGWPSKEHEQKFEVSSALAIVGFNPIPKAIKDFNPDHAEWRNADRTQRMTLFANNKIEVESDNDISLKTPTKVTIDAPLTHMTGNLQVDQSINASVNINAEVAMGAPTLSAPGPGPFSRALMFARNLLAGSVQIKDGTVTASVDVLAAGKSGKSHTHTTTKPLHASGTENTTPPD